MEIFSVFANIGINAKDFNRGIEEAEGRGQSLGSAFLGVSKTIARAGLAIGASVKGIGIAALQVGGQFDSSLRTIEARTGMTAESMGKVGLAFRDLALDGNFSANEIARSFAYVAVAGQDSTEAIGIMENAMVLAGATGVNLGTAAYFLGNYLLKVGKDASYAERYINIFAETNRQTGIGLLTLQDYLFRANVTLQSTNITGYEASAMFGALYQAGIRGANAYSGVENALRSLLVPTEDQIAALDRLYVARHDENGQLKDGIDFLLALGHALGDLEGDTLSYYNALLGSTVAGSAFLGGIVDIKYTLPYMIDDIREAGDALNGTGTAFEMAALKQDTFAGGLGMMRAAGKDALITIFEIIEAPLAQVLARAGENMRNLALRLRQGGDLHPQIQRLGQSISQLGTMVVNFVEAATPLVLRILPALATGLTSVINFAVNLSPAILGVVGAFKAFNLAAKFSGEQQGVLIGWLNKLVSAKERTRIASEKMEAAEKARAAAEQATALETQLRTKAEELARQATEARTQAELMATKAKGGTKAAEAARRKATLLSQKADTLATEAASARMALQKQHTIATNLNTTAQNLQTAATARVTIATKAATVAKRALNAAFKANPIGMVIAGVTALIGGITALVGWLRRGSAETQAMRAENERFIETNNRLIDSVERSRAAHEENIANIGGEVVASERLIARIEKLNAEQELSYEQRTRLAAYVSTLNGLMDDLNIRLDEETGHIVGTTEAIREQIEQRVQRNKQAASEERLVQIAIELGQIQTQHTANMERHYELQARLSQAGEADGRVNFKRVGIQRDLADFATKNNELAYRYIELLAEQDYITNSIVESNIAAGNASGAFAAATETAMQKAAEATRQLREEALQKLSSEFENIQQSATNAFSRISTEAEHSMDDLISNLAHNAEAYTNWGYNIAYVMQGVARKAYEHGQEIDKGVMEALERLLKNGAGYAEMASNDMGRVWEELIPTLRDATEAAVSYVSNVFATDESVVREAIEFANRTSTSVRDTLEAAGFTNMGSYVAKSVGMGIEKGAPHAKTASLDMVEGVYEEAAGFLAVNSPSRLFISLAENIPLGVAIGISNTMNRAVEAAINMARRVHEASRSYLQVRSPSRLFAELAGYIPVLLL